MKKHVRFPRNPIYVMNACSKAMIYVKSLLYYKKTTFSNFRIVYGLQIKTLMESQPSKTWYFKPLSWQISITYF